MRADRLISIMMLLHANGRMTAQQMADELEVSERTIYRDIDALSMSGVPIYAEIGPGGGFDLLDSYRAELMGLTEREINALLTLSVPTPVKQLGIGQDLKGALIKLSAALSNNHSSHNLPITKRVHLDSSPWISSNEQVPYLQLLHQALLQNRKINIKYSGAFNAEIKFTAEPLGIVAKTDIWYLICKLNEHLRVLRVSNIFEIRLLDEQFTYPADFNLIAFWEEWCRESEEVRPNFPVSLFASPELVVLLHNKFTQNLSLIDNAAVPDKNDGWINIILNFESFEEARINILGFGNAAEVVEPVSLRMSIIDYAQQILNKYQHGNSLV